MFLQVTRSYDLENGTAQGAGFYTVLREEKHQDLLVVNLTRSTEFRCIFQRKEEPFLPSKARCRQQVLLPGQTLPPPTTTVSLPAGGSTTVGGRRQSCEQLDKQLAAPRGRSYRTCLIWLEPTYLVSAQRSIVQVEEVEHWAMGLVEQLEVALNAALKRHRLSVDDSQAAMEGTGVRYRSSDPYLRSGAPAVQRRARPIASANLQVSGHSYSIH